jgi:hypothetical protein
MQQPHLQGTSRRLLLGGLSFRTVQSVQMGGKQAGCWKVKVWREGSGKRRMPSNPLTLRLLSRSRYCPLNHLVRIIIVTRERGVLTLISALVALRPKPVFHSFGPGCIPFSVVKDRLRRGTWCAKFRDFTERDLGARD